jgi:protein-serine/threonine kinase
MGICCKKKKKDDDAILIENLLNDKEDDNPFNIKLKMNDFQKIKLLGKGSFGEVYLVKLKRNNKVYAMKILDKYNVRESNQVEHTKVERDLLVKTNCPFVVNIKFAFQDKENLYIITEFMQGGELFFHLHKEKRFDNEKAKFYIVEIILALEYLHSRKMLYRDLKPPNILIDKTGHIKLTDFGLSKIFKSKNDKAYTICGSPNYLAPEILTNKGYDFTVDWWSLGCVMYELLIGLSPFKIRPGESLNEEFYNKEFFMPDYVSEEAQDLIKKLLVINPKKRLGYGDNGANKIKLHPYFKNINWDDAWKKKLNPPFIPQIKDDEDLRYFDTLFTKETILSSDSDYSGLSSNNSGDFKGFTFVSDSIGSELMVMNKNVNN